VFARLGGQPPVAGTSLTFSVSLPQPEGSSAALSLAVAAAVADALDPASTRSVDGQTPQLMLKWPNDLWLRDATHAAGGRKCAGILIESTSASSRGAQPSPRQLTPKMPGRTLVIGVGINIARPELRPSSDYGAAGLCELPRWSQPFGDHPAKVAADAFHAASCAIVQAVLNEAAQGTDAWHASFAARDLLKGRKVRCHAHHGEAITGGVEGGVARGVDRDGALLVERDDGRVVPVVSGEVSVRLV
jgi:BirA family transcriptional regulator, biotin operon repressor / biotin---[acetyl-CoA-carboxylase] ligase